MFVIIGYILVLGSVIGGFMMAGGHVAALLQPNELVIIFGAGTGAFLAANGGAPLRATMKALPQLFKGDKYNKALYMELFALLFEVLTKVRKEGLMSIEKHIKPLLEGRTVNSFLANARYFDALEVEGKRLHTAIRYGLTQALLDAAALSRNVTKAEVILDEYGLPLISEPVPLFGQSGDDRYAAVDKMLLKGVDALLVGIAQLTELLAQLLDVGIAGGEGRAREGSGKGHAQRGRTKGKHGGTPVGSVRKNTGARPSTRWSS